MDDSQYTQRLRLQTRVVLDELERAVGAYLVRSAAPLDAGTTGELTARFQRHGGRGTPTLADLVAETHIEEVVRLAVAATAGHHHHDLMKALHETCTRQDIWAVRNACAHPNRPFAPLYWYKVAALAHEAFIRQLGFDSVERAVASAENGSFDLSGVDPRPLRDWLPRNNLATIFEHSATGLIGRKREVAALRKSLGNVRHRNIALIGPPGVGKTALLLETASQVCQDSSTAAWADAVIYVSIKAQEVTLGGERTIGSPVRSVDEILGRIQDAAAAVGIEFAPGGAFAVSAEGQDLRLVVCIDNLESVLLLNPRAMAEISDALPVRWRVLASSQVAPDGTYPLSVAMLDAGSARQLAREYARSRGLLTLGDEAFGRLGQVWDGNPLAIRLAVDAMAAGASLEDATSASRDAFLGSAYGTLLSLLPPECRRALECLFVDDGLTAARVAMLADEPVEKATYALITLARTSLVTSLSKDQADVFRLTDPIRTLLQRQPADPQTRAAVEVRNRQFKRIANVMPESIQSDDATAFNYVSADTPDEIKAVVADAFAFTKVVADDGSRERATRTLGLVVELRRRHPAWPLLVRAESYLLYMLSDNAGGDRCRLESMPLDDLDDAAKIASVSALCTIGRPADAVALMRPLYARYLTVGATQPKAFRRVVMAYLQALEHARAFEDICAITADWRNGGSSKPVLVAYYVKARLDLHHAAADAGRKSDGRRVLVDDVHKVFDEFFRAEGYVDDVAHVASRAMRLCQSLLRSQSQNTAFTEPILAFWARHLRGLASVWESGFDGRLGHFVTALQKCKSKANPFNTDAWTFVHGGGGRRGALARKGFVVSRVLRPWLGTGRVQLFSESADGTVYFIPGEFLLDAADQPVTRKQATAIRAGDTVMVRPDYSNGLKDRSVGQPIKAAVLMESRPG